jgi:anti-anti-sigma factor
MVIASRTPEGTPNRCPVCGTRLKIEPSDPAGDAPCPRCGHLLWFTWEEVDNTQLIKPTSRVIDVEALERLFQSMPMRRGVQLVLDFEHVQYLSSSALGRFISLTKKVAAVRGKLRMRGIHPDLREVFRVCRLDQVFEIDA